MNVFNTLMREKLYLEAMNQVLGGINVDELAVPVNIHTQFYKIVSMKDDVATIAPLEVAGLNRTMTLPSKYLVIINQVLEVYQTKLFKFNQENDMNFKP